MNRKKTKELTVYSYGKINLSLDVLGLTGDGFHEVDMLMQAIMLHDDVRVSWIPGGRARGVAIDLHTDLPYVPDDERNIAHKAAMLMSPLTPGEGTIKIDIHKRIPVAAGLAGGSGNGAAVLMALSYMWGLGHGLGELMDIGAHLGSDVPFSVMSQAACNGIFGYKSDPLAGTCAIAGGRGTTLSKAHPIAASVVLCKPPISVSTKEVYQGIDDCDIPARPDTAKLASLIRENNGMITTENKAVLKRNMVNVLENYTLSRYDVVKAIKNKIVRIIGQDEIVLMTGSGPTVYALLDDKHAAADLAHRLRQEQHQAFCTRTLI